MAWYSVFSARNVLTAVSFIPVIGAVGAAGTMIMDACDPEMRKNKSWLDWGSDIAGIGLCCIPGGGAAVGAVKVAKIACQVVDKGAVLYHAYEGAEQIYENGITAGSAASVLAAVSGKGKVAHFAEKATLATSVIATAEAMVPPTDPNAVDPNQPILEKSKDEKPVAALAVTKQQEEDIVRAKISEQRAAAEEVKSVKKDENNAGKDGIMNSLASGLVMVAMAIANKAAPKQSIGNQVPGESATDLINLGIQQHAIV
jgi:hypothetical protein